MLKIEVILPARLEANVASKAFGFGCSKAFRIVSERVLLGSPLPLIH